MSYFWTLTAASAIKQKTAPVKYRIQYDSKCCLSGH